MIIYYFHVTKHSREKYQLEENLFSLQGDLIVADFKTARVLADRINKVRKEEGKVSELVTAGQINALGLLHEIFHLIIRKYEDEKNPGVFQKTLSFLKDNLSEDELERTLLKFVEEFPPLSVFQNLQTPQEYLNSKTDNKLNREIILEELILLNLENINPATHQLKELYTDEILSQETSYKKIIEKTEEFFEQDVKIGSENINLIAFLRRPLIVNPYNIDLQLEFLKENWKIFLGEGYLIKILSGKDLIYEDSKLFVKYAPFEKPTPPVPKYDYDPEYLQEIKNKIEKGKILSPEEYEYYQLEIPNFTPDVDWMPNVVMIAKNTFVWLDQLSKKYKREIRRLDKIPDEELDQLANWNFNALWLIGIWERSSASQKIKQMTGNPDAAPSAYSLYDYVIANELGGENAFQNLKYRCSLRGIRLSSDMVPNHTGIFSKWIIEKPHYYIQTSTSPFSVYRFTGPNLSEDPRIEIRIEDQYYSRSDAAVVFERIDRITGDRRYIYHGNDGTNMPWNDTAQLNLMSSEVREALIQTIMQIAKKTPIIRFDAAMTLTKKHYQRLWFPIPGTGGAIPSRAEYAMTRSQFDELMPEEFWREVVDRINKEMPDTLLLAEAFWLMESYFVRTLGMHRVYNSAFMHMFMKEENEKYKELIKNTLLYDPEILKRYVNFMSNPDEETAVNQFGKGKKYFGVLTVMVTMPGLPMFAHGQIEGFSEKYGMEYKRAYYNETPDEHLIWQHKKEIFPLLKKRNLFSQVNNFYLYDFIDSKNTVNENVFVYSNNYKDEKALILYNNSYFNAVGRIDFSCYKITKDGKIINIRIAQALEFKNQENYFYIAKEFVQKDEFIFKGSDSWIFGIYFQLTGYERKVFLEFREVYDTDGRYNCAYKHLQGKPTKSIEGLIKEIELESIHSSFLQWLISEEMSKYFENEKNFSKNFLLTRFINELVKDKNQIDKEYIENKISGFAKKLDLFYDEIFELEKNISKKGNEYIISQLTPENNLNIYRSYLFINDLINLFGEENKKVTEIFEEYLLWKPLYEIFGYYKYGDQLTLYFDLLTIKEHIRDIEDFYSKFLGQRNKSKARKQIDNKLIIETSKIFEKETIKDFIHYHKFEETEYFNKERFEFLIKNLMLLWIYDEFNAEKKSKIKSQLKKKVRFANLIIDRLLKEAQNSDYKFRSFIERINSATS
jgi:glycosidase